jgi:leucyl-tRNA synthetase
MAASIKHDAVAGSVVVMEKVGQNPSQFKRVQLIGFPLQTDKRDYLVDLERSAQSSWQSSRLFETEPPPLPQGVASYADFFATHQSMDDVKAKHPKWFGTFPYAYMNGSFHLGHAFTVSKIEFAAGFERMRGKRVLFPLGYHATGLPIKVSPLA